MHLQQSSPSLIFINANRLLVVPCRPCVTECACNVYLRPLSTPTDLDAGLVIVIPMEDALDA